MRRWRLLLPISVGVLSAGLMVWDIYNQRVARYMALPVWPNQTSEILFRLLNFPAYLAGPVTRAYHLYNPQHYFVLFPGCLVWWYVVGVVLDCGTGTRRLRSSWVWLSLALTLCLLAVGIYVARSPWEWWRAYGDWTRDALLTFLWVATPTIWSFVVAASTGTATIRLLKHN